MRVNGSEQVAPNCARRVERRLRRLQRAKELATLGIGVAVLILVSAGVDYTGWRALKAKRPRAGKRPLLDHRPDDRVPEREQGVAGGGVVAGGREALPGGLVGALAELLPPSVVDESAESRARLGIHGAAFWTSTEAPRGRRRTVSSLERALH